MDVRPAFRSVPVTPVADDVQLRTIEGPQAWLGPELARRPALPVNDKTLIPRIRRHAAPFRV